MDYRMSLTKEHYTKAGKSLCQNESPEPNFVSMKSDWSMDPPIRFNLGDSSPDMRETQNGSKSDIMKKNLDSIFKEVEQKILSVIMKELKHFKRLLSPDYPESSEREMDDDDKSHNRVREMVLKITLHILKMMKQTDLANTLQTKLMSVYQEKLKSRLKEKYQRINEGMSSHGKPTHLNEIYTELYITESESEEINNEHEVRQIETSSRRSETLERSIKCCDIFKPLPEQDKPIKSVLTKGVAGIGKTVSVQKFILDWAEEKENQDVYFIFPLPFRELNLIKKNLSLMELVNHFYIETKQLTSTDYEDYKVMFIFDGLDECRLHLNFHNNQSLSNITESTSVDMLLTNLMKGNLLPSALLWITSRPAAANQIPPECVDHVTEIRGFNELQKEEYFRKIVNDKCLSDEIIKHIRSTRILYIMCRIPVFCWISATVLQRMLNEAEREGEIPKTLTQMFTHFLIFQTKLKSQKYDGKHAIDPHQARKSILSLGKLAYEQLEKGNLIFYEEDLRESGIDVTEVSVYSGVCTQIFREESELHLGKVFSFTHLSIQEFLAALFKMMSFSDQNTKSRKIFRLSMADLLKSELDKALDSENGHWDLFLRFLLGFTLKSNQILLRDLTRMPVNSSDSSQETVAYIKEKIRENQFPEKSFNLFHCLNELNDHSLVNEVQSYLKTSGVSRLSGVKLSPAQWSALVFLLLNSEEKPDEFILSKYDPTEECLLRLMPVVKTCKKADLSKCGITYEGCVALTSALRANPSHMTQLNLNYNEIRDSGVKLLSAVLEDSHCKLQELHLQRCSITDEGCVALTSALKSNPSHLTQLNLSENEIRNSGVKLLSALLEDSHCKLKELHMECCNITDEGCAALTSALRSNPSHLTQLNLSDNKIRDSGVKLLSAVLETLHCKLVILSLERCSITDEGCAALTSALRSNPSHLTQLNLSSNEIRDSGLMMLYDLQMDPKYKLQKLSLSRFIC